MTLFTNGYITLPIPKGFQSINSTEEFVELVLVDPTKPMTIKVSVTPTLAGLVDIKESNEFLFVKDNNLYSFEFVYPYADAELDDFYLNMIRSLKIGKAKYIVEKESYRLNE